MFEDGDLENSLNSFLSKVKQMEDEMLQLRSANIMLSFEISTLKEENEMLKQRLEVESFRNV